MGQAFNFGTETPITVLALVDRILALLEKTSLIPKLLNEASHEIQAQYLDCSKARRMLGWKPHYTLEHGLRETIVWYPQWLSRSANFGPPPLGVSS